MKQIIINLENPEILSLEKTGDKDAIAKVKTDLTHHRFQSTSDYFLFLWVSPWWEQGGVEVEDAP